MTVRTAVQTASARLVGPLARRDAETLLLHVLGRDRAWLLAHPEAPVSATQEAAFAELVGRRTRQEPLQYLLGHQEFFGLDLRVSPAVLIPRPETEVLVESVLDWAAGQLPTLRIVDVGTGSGAIACAVASRLPEARLWALDVSKEALAVASGNAERLGLVQRVRFVLSDLLQAVASVRPFDAVVSNPPYVPTTDGTSLEPQVRDFEPPLALFAGEDGLAVYRRLIPEAWSVLRPGGLLAMEFGFGQAELLAALLERWREVRILPDLAGIPRVVLAVRP